MPIITRVGPVALAVTDLDASLEFAVQILGLRTSLLTDDAAYLTCNERHHEVVLVRSPSAGLHYIGLEVSGPADLERVRQIVSRCGIAEVSLRPAPEIEQSFGFVFPEGGATFMVFHGMTHSSPGSAFYPSLGPRPRKFGHVTLRSDRVDDYVSFFCDELGFRVSDWLGTDAVWMRNSSDHHSLAVIRGGEGMHHYALELEHFGAFEHLGDNLIGRESVLEYGPGRHGPGYNLFSYMRDPDGMLCEHFADIQQIEDPGYVAKIWPIEPRSINQWGPQPPESWLPAIAPHVPAKHVARA